MREIKFRAWDTKQNKFVLNIDGVSLDGVILDLGVGEYGLVNRERDVELMQYTGLKDKNGKEIYEGDILKFNTKGGNEMVYEVKWKGKGFKPTRMSEDNQEEIEIIGNIYENKELLERL